MNRYFHQVASHYHILMSHATLAASTIFLSYNWLILGSHVHSTYTLKFTEF
jgi:hypothetical protein